MSYITSSEKGVIIDLDYLGRQKFTATYLDKSLDIYELNSDRASRLYLDTIKNIETGHLLLENKTISNSDITVTTEEKIINGSIHFAYHDNDYNSQTQSLHYFVTKPVRPLLHLDKELQDTAFTITREISGTQTIKYIIDIVDLDILGLDSHFVNTAYGELDDIVLIDSYTKQMIPFYNPDLNLKTFFNKFGSTIEISHGVTELIYNIHLVGSSLSTSLVDTLAIVKELHLSVVLI